jgi:RHS repeat-associated protein
MNGNQFGDGTRTFEWDGEDRLTAINNGTQRSEFSYDGLSRRIRIVEKTNGSTTSDLRYLWCGEEICEERDSTGATTTKRFFPLGEQQGSTNLYYTRDHLAGIREVVDSTDVVRARYDYDPYGRVTKVSGDLNASFTFAGYYMHAPSNLLLTHYRAYDPNLGRWLSQDPLGQRSTSVYTYANNMPVTSLDPLGLWSPKGHELIFLVGLTGVAPASDIAALAASSQSWDKETGWGLAWANSHYMKMPFQSQESAKRGAERFIESRIFLAQLAQTAGDRCEALRLLGQAMHTIQDSSSPAHADRNGLPKTWPYNLPRHVLSVGDVPGGNEGVVAITPQIYESQRKLLTAAYRRVFSQ